MNKWMIWGGFTTHPYFWWNTHMDVSQHWSTGKQPVRQAVLFKGGKMSWGSFSTRSFRDGECMCWLSQESFEVKHPQFAKTSEIYWNCGLSNQKAVMLTRSTLRFGLRFVIHLNHELLGFENQKRTDSIYVSHSQNLWQCKIDPLCKLHIPFKEGILGCQSEIPRYPMWVCRDASQN